MENSLSFLGMFKNYFYFFLILFQIINLISKLKLKRFSFGEVDHNINSSILGVFGRRVISSSPAWVTY